MEFEQLLELIRTVSASGLTAFKFEEKDTKVCMENKREAVAAAQTDSAAALRMPDRGKETAEASQTSSEEHKEAEGELVISPLVGIFYTAPQEDAEAYVKVGDVVKKGQVLAIIEAMKLMNEIESETDGTVTEILAENGQAVEYGQPLFRIA